MGVRSPGGVAMKEIRNLLLDCRTALRKAHKDFDDHPLRELLDDTIIELGEQCVREQARAAPSPKPVASPVGQRVAYAWQSVARELRKTHPELYQDLSARVTARLDEEVIDDPQDEIDTLRQRLGERQAEAVAATAELAALRDALESAVPLAHAHGGTEAERARERLDLLVRAANQGGGLPKVSPAVTKAAEDSRVPDRDLLQQVVAGQHRLSNDQREWCVGEAMVLTGFAHDPADLIARGDAVLAQLVLGHAQA